MFAALVVLSYLASFVYGAASFHSSVHSLVARQSTISPADIPSQCTNQCTPFINTLNDCTTSDDTTCGCDTSTQSQLNNCFDCLIDLAPTVKSQLDETEQIFYQACSVAGKPIAGAPTDFETSSSTSSENIGFTNAGPTATGTAEESGPSSSDPFPEENNAVSISLHPLLLTLGTLVFGGILGF